MKLDYPFIFEGDGFDTIAGCGLTKGYVRFLLQLGTQHHTFYNQSDRYTLTDSEVQLLESGHGSLTDLLVNGCAMNNTKVVGDFDYVSPVQIAGANTEIINWSANYVDSSHINVINSYQFLTLQTGYYHIMAQLTAEQTQGFSNGTFLYDLRFNMHGGVDNEFAYSFWQGGVSPSAKLDVLNTVAGTFWFYFRVNSQSTGLANFSAANSWLKIVYYE